LTEAFPPIGRRTGDLAFQGVRQRGRNVKGGEEPTRKGIGLSRATAQEPLSHKKID